MRILTERVTLDTPLFTTRDLADLLGVSTNFIRAQVAAGELHASTNHKGSRSRRLLRFSLNDVIAYDRDAGQRLKQQHAA